MNEKTEKLRNIFTSVTDEETVTESQEDTRGSLEQDERTVDERLLGVIEQMRGRYEFDPPLTEKQLLTITKRFYEDDGDEEIADDLGVSPEVVFEARMSLHLIADDDASGIDLAAMKNHEEDEGKLTAEYDVDGDRIRRYRRVAEAKEQSLTANDRYRDEFDAILADADLSSRMARDVREDGLEDATEGMETDVSF